MTHFDLFSGYGGFSLALEKIYGDYNRQTTDAERGGSKDLLRDLPNTECDNVQSPVSTIGFSEIDKYASAVLKYHWPNTKNYGDITKINWAEVPDFDLLTGGSPCQDLSIAGKRAGLSGRRSGLFYEFMRAVEEKKPRYFIWENVKGALSSQNGWDFAAVINKMAEAGYSLWWQVLNAKDFGVPQNRERIFVIGFRDGSPREIFFESGSGGQNLKEITQEVSDAQRIYNPDGLAKSQKALSGGLGAKTGLYAVPEATKQGYAIAEEGDSINLSVINSKTRRGRVGHGIAQTVDTGMQQHTISRQPLKFLDRNQKNIEGDYSFTVDSMNTGGVKIDSRIRRLTPTECERLMGLPDGWTKYGRKESVENNRLIIDNQIEISDSQRYKLCGNGVVVNVVEELLKEIILYDHKR